MKSLGLIPARYRISLGLVGLMIGNLLFACAIGCFPNEQRAELEGRAKVAHTLAMSGTAMASTGQTVRLEALFESIAADDPTIHSIALRGVEGEPLAVTSNHEQCMAQTPQLDVVQVPVRRGGDPWGRLEICFSSAAGFMRLNAWAPAWLCVVLIPTCFVQFAWFLRARLESPEQKPHKRTPTTNREPTTTAESTDQVASVAASRSDSPPPQSVTPQSTVPQSTTSQSTVPQSTTPPSTVHAGPRPLTAQPQTRLDAGRPNIAAPIQSTLLTDDPNNVRLVHDFVSRLDQQLDRISESLTEGDFDLVRSSADWLKGNGESAGFHDFVTPASALETAVNQEDVAQASMLLQQIRSLQERLSVPNDTPMADQQEASVDESQQVSAVQGDPIQCSLPLNDPVFARIVGEFLQRLDGRLDGMRRLCDQGNLEELADEAHWLKGSGGTVGFMEFCEPCKKLEAAAHAEDRSAAAIALGEVVDVRRRIPPISVPSRDS